MIFDNKALNMALADGRIIVDPLVPELVGHNSIDFRLGEDLWEYSRHGYEDEKPTAALYGEPTNSKALDSFFYGTFSWKKFGKVEPAVRGSDEEIASIAAHTEFWNEEEANEHFINYMAGSVPDGTEYFVLKPNSYYLATSLEKFGTSAGSGVVPSVRAKSTTGRNFLTVALCAGLGDEGYAGRWALEVHTADAYVPIAVGTVIGQAVFEHTVSGPGTTNDYKKDSGYQKPDGGVSFLPKAMKVIPR